MDACMNKEQQVPEYQQTAKAAIEHAKEQERVHTAQKYNEISSDSSSSSSSDESLETSLENSYDSGTRKTQPNQFCHLINHPYFRLNASLITKKHP